MLVIPFEYGEFAAVWNLRMNRETIMPANAAEQAADPAGNVSPEELLVQAFQSFEAELLGTLYHMLGNMEDARDAIQEAFIRCWKRQDSLHEIQNLRAWIFRIAYNISLDIRKSAWRRKKQALGEKEPDVVATELQPDAQMQQKEELGRIREAIQSLDESERDVFLLRQNGDMSFDQIAQTLDIPIGTAKTRMRRAVLKLHGILNTDA